MIILFSLLLSALPGFSLCATGADGVPPMNAAGLILLAVAIGGLALGAGIIVNYVEKYRDINRKDRDRKK